MRSSLLASFLLGLTTASAAAAQPGAAPATPEARTPEARGTARRPAALDSAARGSATWARYTGRYTLADSAGGGDTPLRVFEQGGALFGQLRTNTPTRLVFLGGDAFRPAAAPEFTMTFALPAGRAASGRADSAAVRGPGVFMRGPRNSRDPGDAPALAPALASEGDAADVSRRGALYDQVVRLDSLLFDASYVRCDTAAVNALLADDVEFYHDQTGFHRGAQVRDDFRRLAANCPRGQGIARVLVPGSLRAYPISAYGAVQTGEHRFVRRDGAPGAAARFVHLWRREPDGAWRLARVLSFDHREDAGAARGAPPAAPAPGRTPGTAGAR